MPGSNSSNERLIALANKAIGKITEWLPPARITPELRALKPDEAFVTPGSPCELRIRGRRDGSYITLTVELSEDNILVRGVLHEGDLLPVSLRKREPDEALPARWHRMSDQRAIMEFGSKVRRIVSDDLPRGRGARLDIIERQRERVAA